MKIKKFFILSAVFFLGANIILLTGCKSSQKIKSDLPNIIMISIDTLRADHLHAYGYPFQTSPNLDKFAEKSSFFEYTFCPIPKTSASFSSIMTGLHPFIHKCKPNRGTLKNKFTTLAEILNKHGYQTSAVVANANLAKKFKFNQGFDNYTEVWTHIENKKESTPFISDKIHKLLSSPPKEPFFFWANYIEPHTPYLPPEKFVEPREKGRDIRTVNPRVMAGMIGAMKVSGNYNEGHYTALYDATVKYMDSELGKIFDRFFASSLSKNTIFIIVADHGEDLGEYNFFYNHGPLTFTAASRVPLIIYFPGEKPRRISHPVSLMDIYPTILKKLEIIAPYKLQGENLFSGKTRRKLYLFGQAGTYGMVQGRYHYVRGMPRLQKDLGLAPYYVFDLYEDPRETRNIYMSHRTLALSLEKEFQAYFHRHGYIKKIKTREPKLSEKERKSLKTLGYL